MPNFQIQDNQGMWKIEGRLTFKTITTVEQESHAIRIKWPESVVLDFSELDDIDSAGIAWILENIKFARKKDIKLYMIGLMLEKVQPLIDMYQLNSIMEKYVRESK
jgi:ABC-type transporter Mla MlaB component